MYSCFMARYMYDFKYLTAMTFLGASSLEER